MKQLDHSNRKCLLCKQESLIYFEYGDNYSCEWCAHTFLSDGTMIECNYNSCVDYGYTNQCVNDDFDKCIFKKSKNFPKGICVNCGNQMKTYNKKNHTFPIIPKTLGIKI